MTVRTIVSGALAAALMTAVPAQAGMLSGLFGGNADQSRREPERSPDARSGLPGVFGGSNAAPNVQLAQANDPRVVTLEEQVRKLNGTIEELNFQILQLQEQMRKTQEDNEFRFQEIEKKSEGARPAKKSEATSPDQNAAVATSAPATTTPSAQTEPRSSVQDVIASDQTNATGAATTTAAGAPATTRPGTGAPPKSFGTITFDPSGNVTGGAVGDHMTAVPDGSEPDSSTVVAALPKTNDPEELYRNSYNFILSGDYATAEAGFRDHISRFPTDTRASDAHFWLGESLLGQRKYRDAAEVFLDGTKTYPKAKKAPDMLLKLGVSLAGLDQHDVACATFLEVAKRYPETSGALKERVKQEQARASC